MVFKSINPSSQEILAVFEADLYPEIRISSAKAAFGFWKNTEFGTRQQLLISLAKVLEKNKEVYAKDISLEMGKVLSDSIKEIEKCASTIMFYAQNSLEFLLPKIVKNSFHKSYYTFEPQGGIFAIMPWNFPFWQVLRFAVPTILSGNVVLLKHAPNVLISANHIVDAFEEAGFPKNILTLLTIDIDLIEKVISNDFIKGVTLTGSNVAGSSVASLAGKYLKKTVLELGGSDPFVVLEGANIELAAINAVKSRFQNAGQTCIAAKRWLVEASVYDEFLLKVTTLISEIKVGDPFNEVNNFGPLARLDLAEKIEAQMEMLENLGAKVVIKGHRDSCKMEPSLYLINRKMSMKFTEELLRTCGLCH